MKRLALVLILAASGALAQEPPRPSTPDEVAQIDGLQKRLVEDDSALKEAREALAKRLTADEGKKLYEYGLKVGMAQAMARAAVEAAQQDARPVLEKLQPPAAKP